MDLVVSIFILEEEWAWLHGCYIRVVANRTDIHEIYEELESDGITCLTPILMGDEQDECMEGGDSENKCRQEGKENEGEIAIAIKRMTQEECLSNTPIYYQDGSFDKQTKGKIGSSNGKKIGRSKKDTRCKGEGVIWSIEAPRTILELGELLGVVRDEADESLKLGVKNLVVKETGGFKTN
ncbi:hypothetical protein VNO77_02849 [Canavalia gladiata]|uniref:Uncharacterized protein n=1 Tax=Canavalia gladiata TaxID=3824 RepID=A0AAN9MZB3_CANGL